MVVNSEDEGEYYEEINPLEIVEDILRINYDSNNPTPFIDKLKTRLGIKTKNIAFMVFETEINGIKHKGFLITDTQIQFLPGTYYYLKNGRLKIKTDPNAGINHRYAASWNKGAIAWSHSERKLLLAFQFLFNLENLEHLDMTLISDLPFCPSCKNMIRIFLDEFGINIKSLDDLGDDDTYHMQFVKR